MQKRMDSIKSYTSAREPCSQTRGSDLCYAAYVSWYGYLHTSNLLCEKIWAENPTLSSGKSSICFLSVELAFASETDGISFNITYICQVSFVFQLLNFENSSVFQNVCPKLEKKKKKDRMKTLFFNTVKSTLFYHNIDLSILISIYIPT